MAGVYSGNFADAKLIHPLDTKDGDQVGPGSYTLLDGANIQSTDAVFDSALSCAALRERMLSNAAVSGGDQTDTAKILMHFWWKPVALGVEHTFAAYTPASGLSHRFRFFRDVPNGFLFRWHRGTDFTPGNPTIQVRGLQDTIVTSAFNTIVAFLDANSITQGKVFVNGVDKTFSVVPLAIAASPGPHDHILLGNHDSPAINTPARFMDHFTLIQASSLNNTKVTALVTQYDDTRGFGHRPTFTSTDITDVNARDVVNMTGTGFGKDVIIKVDGKDALNVVRLSESLVSFQVPLDVSTGLLDIAITNVESNVTFTEADALSHQVTIWTPGGLSDRVGRVGDGMLIGSGFFIGAPTPFCDPNLNCTPWTRTTLEP